MTRENRMAKEWPGKKGGTEVKDTRAVATRRRVPQASRRMLKGDPKISDNRLY